MKNKKILKNLRKYLQENCILIPYKIDPEYDNAIAINNMYDKNKEIHLNGELYGIKSAINITKSACFITDGVFIGDGKTAALSNEDN